VEVASAHLVLLALQVLSVFSFLATPLGGLVVVRRSASPNDGDGPLTPLTGLDPVLKAGDQVSLVNSFIGSDCSITSHCNNVFDPQPSLPGNLACCTFDSVPEVWTVESVDSSDNAEHDFRFKSKNGEYLCAIDDKLYGLWQGDTSQVHGFYVVTKTEIESGCSYAVEPVQGGEVALRSRCGEGQGKYVGINTAGFRGKNGEIPMCAVWDSIVNTGHTYRVDKAGATATYSAPTPP